MNTTTATTTLLDELRATAASLADFDRAPPDLEVNHHAVSALLSRAVAAIESAEAARETMRRERTAAMNERDAARAALASCDETRMRNAEHYRDACNGLATRERELAAAYSALRVYGPRCEWPSCGALATCRGVDPANVERASCDQHNGDLSGVWTDPSAAAMRAATKAVA